MKALRPTLRLGTGLLALAAFAIPSTFCAIAAAQPPAGSAPAGTTPQGGQGGFGGGMGRMPVDAKAAAAPRTIAPYFVPALKGPKAPDADGFLQRWLLLEPINKPNRSNTVFIAPYVRENLNHEYFPGQFTDIPRNGDHVKVGDQDLAWHALDSTNFDVKLFNFAYGLNKQTYGVIFYAVTVVNSPRDMDNVRLAVGSNSASIWWLNGQTVDELFDDRRMAMDDVISKRLTLKKGKNVLRGAVINGPGLSDFCVRFIDENGNPVKDITTSLE